MKDRQIDLNARYVRVNSMMTEGFIIDCFSGLYGGKAAVFVTGKLSNGETFGIIDNRLMPSLFILSQDEARAREAGLLKSATIAPTSLRTMKGETLVCLEVDSSRALYLLNGKLQNADIRTYEGDTDFAFDYLRRHDLRGSITIDGDWRSSEQVSRVYVNPHVSSSQFVPALRTLSFDIETDITTEQILAISLVIFSSILSEASEEVLIVSKNSAAFPTHVIACEDEKKLLELFQRRVKALDPDIVTGWNIVDFDLPVLLRRFAIHKMPWALDRTKPASAPNSKSKFIDIRGRQILDALRLVRASSLRFEDLRLGTVAQVLLNREKTISANEGEDRPEKLLSSYYSDPVGFAEYCLEDSRLVRDILKKAQLLDLTVKRSLLIGLPLSRTWGSVVPFEFIYMTELLKRGYAAPSHGVDAEDSMDVAGGLVLEPRPGLYRDVFVFDFRSLYPSIMRTFNIDPLAHAMGEMQTKTFIEAPNGAKFSRQQGILPEILDRFFESRAQAQKQGDAIASYAYKIIMNSFYGVLGTDSCRFAAPSLAGAITSFGHEVLRRTRDQFENLGYEVLYGDTDSLFVAVGENMPPQLDGVLSKGKSLAQEMGGELANHIRDKYGVQSRLELKFEKYYAKLLLPNSRGGESKAKNYAGVKRGLEGDQLEVTGMEAIRSDWTPLARNLQLQLLELLFKEAPKKEIVSHIQKTVRAVLAGKLDQDLVYRKTIRRELASYTKTTPPHVKAARLLPHKTRVVRYMQTISGPQPLGYITAAIDFDHYIEKQIAPIVDPFAELAKFDGPSSYRIDSQLGLFDRN